MFEVGLFYKQFAFLLHLIYWIKPGHSSIAADCNILWRMEIVMLTGMCWRIDLKWSDRFTQHITDTSWYLLDFMANLSFMFPSNLDFLALNKLLELIIDFKLFSDESWEKRWTYSTSKGSDAGKFKLSAGKFYGDKDKDLGTKKLTSVQTFLVLVLIFLSLCEVISWESLNEFFWIITRNCVYKANRRTGRKYMLMTMH